MRVGVVTTSYPRWDGDPAGHFVAEHVAQLERQGFDVEVVAAGDENENENENEHVARTRPRLFSAPGSIRRVLAPPGLFYVGGAPDALEAGAVSPLAAARFTARFAATVARRSRRWSACVAHWLAPSALAAIASPGPLLAIAHGGDVHVLARRGLLAPAIALLAARRARLVFVSDDLRARCRAELPGPLARWLDRHAIVQPMGVELARFAAVPPPPAASPPTIAVLARMVPIKGVDVAIDAMAELREPARLVIAGGGPEAEPLARRAARVGATSGHPIELCGAVDTARRDAILAAASVVVLPSRAHAGRVEGAPVAAIEALAAGRPVIATATGGLAELPAPVRLIAPDDPVALARAIADVLRRPPPPEECRRAARPRAWAAVANRLREHWSV